MGAQFWMENYTAVGYGWFHGGHAWSVRQHRAKAAKEQESVSSSESTHGRSPTHPFPGRIFWIFLMSKVLTGCGYLWMKLVFIMDHKSLNFVILRWQLFEPAHIADELVIIKSHTTPSQLKFQGTSSWNSTHKFIHLFCTWQLYVRR